MPNDPHDFIASLAGDLTPVRPLRQRGGMILAIGALLAGAAGMTALFGLRADLMAGHPNGIMLLSTGLYLVLALASAWAAIDMARPQVGVRRDGWGWNALTVAVLPLTALVLMALNVLDGVPSGLHLEGESCLRHGLLWGMLTGASLTLWLRRGAPARPNLAGLLVGIAAGSAGTVAVSLFCPHNEVVHVGFWHGLTVIVAGLAGRLFVPHLIRW